MTLSRTLTAVLLLLAAALACATDPTPDPELRDALRAAASASPSFTDRFDGEVWLTDMSARLARQVKNPEERIELLTLVHMEAKRVDLPPELILAVIEVESNFDRFAISVAGARGQLDAHQHQPALRLHDSQALLRQGKRRSEACTWPL
jgi:soluble lytic murein transglycosylase-like protein